MRIGLIGAGNMATALARGWGEPVLVADVDHARAQALAAELGGEAPGSNAYVADAADAVVLCHKPAQLAEVADEIRDRAKAVVSILGGTPLADVEAAYPGKPVYRFMPNIPAEVGEGVFAYAAGSLAAAGPEREALALFGQIGTVVPTPEPLIDTAMAVMSCSPAFFALAVEALVDAAGPTGRNPRGPLRWGWARGRAPQPCCALTTSTRSRCAGGSPRRAGRPRAASPPSSAAACATRSRAPSTPWASHDPRDHARRRKGLRQHPHHRLRGADLHQDPDELLPQHPVLPGARPLPAIRHGGHRPVAQPVPPLHPAGAR